MKIVHLAANPGGGEILKINLNPNAKFLAIQGTLIQTGGLLLTGDGKPQLKPQWSVWFENPDGGESVERTLLLVQAVPGELVVTPPESGEFSDCELHYLGTSIIPNAMPIIATHLYELRTP
jgi:hypothetical protein